jgi:mycothiol synthase
MADDGGALAWRPITKDQTRAWADLFDAMEEADRQDLHIAEHELREELDDPGSDFPDGSIAAWDGDLMVAFGQVFTRDTAEAVHEMRLFGGVRPSHRRRGIGRQLVAWGERAAPPLHQKKFPDLPLNLQGWCYSKNPGEIALFAACGYQQIRWWRRMNRDLSEPLPERAADPDGIQIVGFTADRAEEARLVRNAAFRDHWGSSESTAESWAHHLAEVGFRPQFSFLAYDRDGRALGMLHSEEFDSDTKANGHRDVHVGLVGTRREARGRGIASALVSRVLTAAKADGCANAWLLVDSESPSGAVGLYERLGFRPVDSWITTDKPLLPGDQAGGRAQA